MLVGCPIRIPADQVVCAHPRSFSQLVASFFASESLGIPHAPFFAFSPVAVNYRRPARLTCAWNHFPTQSYFFSLFLSPIMSKNFS
jgi:hypothetical protein